mgnify:CR=1 FL=1
MCVCVCVCVSEEEEARHGAITKIESERTGKNSMAQLVVCDMLNVTLKPSSLNIGPLIGVPKSSRICTSIENGDASNDGELFVVIHSHIPGHHQYHHRAVTRCSFQTVDESSHTLDMSWLRIEEMLVPSQSLVRFDTVHHCLDTCSHHKCCWLVVALRSIRSILLPMSPCCR